MVTEPTYPQHFATVFDAAVARRGDETCQIHGSRRVTWRETRRRALGVGAALRDAGVARQEKVAQFLFNTPEYLETVWACFASALVPVNTNYRYKDSELLYLWDNADVVAVVFHGTFTETIERIKDKLPEIRTWLWVDDGTLECPSWASAYELAATSERDEAAPWAPPSGDDVTLLYTGGTTGLPKGVVWRMSDYTGILVGPIDPSTGLGATSPTPPPIHLPACPLMHGVGLHSSFKAMSQGGSIVTLEGRRFDPVELLEAVERHRVTSVAIVGDAFAKPLLGALDEHPNRWDISSIRQLTSSGVALSTSTKAGLFEHNPTMVILDTLGSSEAMGVAGAVTTRDDVARPARFKPSENARVIGDDGREVLAGSGVTGSLAVKGRVPLAYYKDPEKSAATFREIDGVRWSFPGDLATIEADGSVLLFGRGSLCINRGGEKVYPEEVEGALKAHRGVQDAVVVGLPDDRLGEEVYAVVELSGDQVAASELIAFVREHLAGYKAPKQILAVEAIDRPANGKADYARWKSYASTMIEHEARKRGVT
jgi:acyl-CoA synthetase (AMP-forming)/AMP-acid ligase II